MRTFDEHWDGTKAKTDFLLNWILFDDDDGLAAQYPQLNKREVAALFQAALARNVVQNEIFQMAEYIIGKEGVIKKPHKMRYGGEDCLVIHKR